MDGLPLNVDVGSLNAARGADRARELAGREGADALEAGQELEALFATLLVKELRKALPNEGFFGAGRGADVFNGWMDEYLGQQLAEDGALDLAGRVKVALDRQEDRDA